MESVFVLLKEVQIGDVLEDNDRIVLEHRAVFNDFNSAEVIVRQELHNMAQEDIEFMSIDDPDQQYDIPDYAIGVHCDEDPDSAHTFTLYRRIPDSLERLALQRFVVADSLVMNVA